MWGGGGLLNLRRVKMNLKSRTKVGKSMGRTKKVREGYPRWHEQQTFMSDGPL